MIDDWLLVNKNACIIFYRSISKGKSDKYLYDTIYCNKSKDAFLGNTLLVSNLNNLFLLVALHCYLLAIKKFARVHFFSGHERKEVSLKSLEIKLKKLLAAKSQVKPFFLIMYNHNDNKNT